MYSAVPPPLATVPVDGAGERLHVIRAGRRAFAGSSAAALDPALRVYLSDMIRPHQVQLREDLLGQGAGHSYGEMAEQLLRDTVSADEPVDLLILAFAIPDVIPGRATASYLSHVCPGGPLAFAICDQGRAAAFTGLRLAGEYQRAGDCARALLVVVEQAALHYGLVAPASVPDGHAAVALLLADAGAARIEAVHQHPDISAGQLGDLLAAEIAAMSPQRPKATLIAGASLGAARPAALRALRAACAEGQVRVAQAGQPYTGVWWELAGALAGPPGAVEGVERTVLLADYDPELRYLCLAVMDIQAGGSAAPASSQSLSLAKPDAMRSSSWGVPSSARASWCSR